MKRKLLFLGTAVVIIGIVAAVVAAALWQPERTVEVGEGGFLEGTVTFVGLPCPPEEVSGRPPQVPSCSGPYPNYGIVVYGADGITEVARTTSDQDGNYKISLVPGDYVIYTPNGPFESDLKANWAAITSEETIKLDLVVDTGVR